MHQQLSLFTDEAIIKPQIQLEELFEAYYECRRNKRNTLNALAFEIDYENNLVQLCNAINNNTYTIGSSIAFIVNKPVKREIFAADFCDRIIHHLIIRKLNPLFEKHFINDSYACRKGKGTHFGIRRVERFVRCASHNYTQDCYVLKLDILGFFMSINKNTLWRKLEIFIEREYKGTDKEIVLRLSQKIIAYTPHNDCLIKGKRTDWDNLPPTKSLFHSQPNCGLPIGNLSSQVFANFYMNEFDHYVKHDLGIRYYGRYVDDFILVHPSKAYLKSLIPKLSQYLSSELQLTLHPKKIHLQHYSKGVKYIGAVILPNRTYIANRTKGNFYTAMTTFNHLIRERKPTNKELEQFRSTINSYLGIMKHFRSYNIRKRMIFETMDKAWWEYFYFTGGLKKCVLKRIKN